MYILSYVLMCEICAKYHILIDMIFMCEWKMNSNLSYLNVIEMLKVHRLSQCLHTTNMLVMLILLENEECK